MVHLQGQSSGEQPSNIGNTSGDVGDRGGNVGDRGLWLSRLCLKLKQTDTVLTSQNMTPNHRILRLEGFSGGHLIQPPSQVGPPRISWPR